MLNDVYEDTRDRMNKAIDSLDQEFRRVRTGRASVALVDGIRVEYYGTPTPLSQLATLTVPEPRSITIQPWDSSIVSDVEKAIMKSELGLTPMSDGKIIRINIPVLTAERRKDLVKIIKKKAEEAKVAVRNIRRDVNEVVKELKTAKKISEDEQFRAQEETQKITDDYIKKVDAVYSAKEKEIWKSEMHRLDFGRLPRHVAVIMDGNGRWAKQKLRNRIFGHEVGASSVREAAQCCLDLRIPYLTLYAFSKENWRRPDVEVKALWHLLRRFLKQELQEMIEKGIRVRHLGDEQDIPADALDQIHTSVEETARCDKLVMSLAINYGGRQEIARAARLFAEDVLKGKARPDDLDPDLLGRYLFTADLPDPDLMIRTGGESRVSNFLPWQLTYSELYFTEVLWPDFRRDQFVEALLDYQHRERRFGKTSDQVRQEAGE